MDVARAPQKKRGRLIAIGGGVLALIFATVALGRLRPAAPTVDGANVFSDTVRRGEMVREVRGPGNLVPEHIRWITAQASARVDKLVAQSGQTVGADAILLEMSNPAEQIQLLQAEQALSQAQSALVTLRVQLENQRLTQEGVVASTQTQYMQAMQEAAGADSLSSRNLLSRNEINNKKAAAAELTTRLRIEQARLRLMTQTVDSQIGAQVEQVDRLKAIAAFQRNRVTSLSVRAGEPGVLQEMTLQLGQWVTEGTTLGKVVQPGNLKAVLRIPETQAKDVQIGQSASIDTRNGIIAGHVSRKDPSSSNGTVTVDVHLDGPLPAGAVPDLSIDGTVQIERLKDVLYTGRPSYGAGTGMVGLFKYVDNGDYAVRVQVQLGRSSVSTVEIVRGLNVGDRVILSDMSQWDAVDRVRLK